MFKGLGGNILQAQPTTQSLPVSWPSCEHQVLTLPFGPGFYIQWLSTRRGHPEGKAQKLNHHMTKDLSPNSLCSGLGPLCTFLLTDCCMGGVPSRTLGSSEKGSRAGLFWGRADSHVCP